jgi:multidrug resistance efflux pump
MSILIRFFIGLSIIALGALSFAVMQHLKAPPPKQDEKPTSPLVSVIDPIPQEVTFSIATQGVVVPHTETALTSEVSGRIEQVSEKFVAGGLLQKGEVILKIDSSEYALAVEQAKARLAGREAQYAQERARSQQALKEWELTGKPASQAPALALRKPFLQEAEANVESAKADLKQAEQKLSRTIIRAPYTAMVKTRQVGLGQYVTT